MGTDLLKIIARAHSALEYRASVQKTIDYLVIGLPCFWDSLETSEGYLH
jgi:hypothetical protein